VHPADSFHAARLISAESPVEDAYAAWAEANRRCAEALRAWRAATAADRDDAYHAYQLRLDNEEAAAGHLAEIHGQRDACGS
jgi:hypothetical protein